MKNLITFLSLIFLLALWSCKSEPFKTKLAGYTVQFPAPIDSLREYHPNGYHSWSDRFVDSTQESRIDWLFNMHEFGEDTIYKVPDRRQAYGVSIYLKNKGNQLDSVKTALEKQFGRNLLLLNVTRLGKYEPYQPNPPVYICHLNANTILALSKASSYRGEPWSQYNSVKISIGYGLDATEEERFAVKGGYIHEDTD